MSAPEGERAAVIMLEKVVRAITTFKTGKI